MYTKEPIDVIEHLSDVMRNLKKGILLTTKRGAEVNTMTVSWGQIGVEWEKLLFTVFVRTGRHSCAMLEETGEFTINVNPEGKVGKITGFCGTKSGKDVDKIDALGLTLVDGNSINVPGIAELPLTLECKVIYHRLQNKAVMSDDILTRFYPQDVASDYHGDNKDLHMVFLGEIVDSYMIKKKC